MPEYDGGLGFTFDQIAHRRLWAAVFKKGLDDAAIAFRLFCAQKAKPEDKRPMNSYSALYWLNSDDRFTGSFVWLCELFELDPARARSTWRMKVREIAKGAEP